MKKNKNTTVRERHNEAVINELFGSLENEPDIETDIADLGSEPEDDTVVATEPKRHKFFFGFAVFVIIMAVIGIYSSVMFIADGMRSLMDNTSLKDEFTKYLLPVVANDIAPFQNDTEISNTAKINCSIWNIMVNKDMSEYKVSDMGEYVIPEYDVLFSCRELFGSSAVIAHQTVGASDTRFAYDETNHVYTCSRNLRNLNYAPRISEMKENNGTYTLTVEYIPPSVALIADNLGIEVSAVKTMEYTINRWEGKNTLMSVKLISVENV